MIGWLIDFRLDALERQLGASLDYLRRLAAVSRFAFFKFAMILQAASHRRVAARDMIHTVRLVASQAEDCGTCVQIAAQVARQEGMPAELVAAVLAENVARAPEDIRLAFQFASSVVHHRSDDGRWRDELRRRFGEAAVMELSLAIARSRVFPTLKRGMGYATGCQIVQMDTGLAEAV